MGLERFEFESLAVLDGGRIKEAFMQALRRCESDCRDRPLLEKARTITLEMVLEPRVDEDTGALIEMVAQFRVKDRNPVRESKVYHLNAKGAGLFFNADAPEDPRQLTIDETVKGGRADVG